VGRHLCRDRKSQRGRDRIVPTAAARSWRVRRVVQDLKQLCEAFDATAPRSSLLPFAAGLNTLSTLFLCGAGRPIGAGSVAFLRSIWAAKPLACHPRVRVSVTVGMVLILRSLLGIESWPWKTDS